MRESAVVCPECGYDLSRAVLSVESVDEELWEQSGIYCPMCFANAVIARASELEPLMRNEKVGRVAA